MSHIAIIGAGITGVTTAYALLLKGHTVTIFDRNRYPAMETSFANGGQLSASNAEVWNSPHTLWNALRWLTRRDAPLLLNFKPSWHKYSWLAEFVAHIPDYRANTIETTRLAILARQYMQKWASDENIQFDLERRGILHIYQDKAAFDHAAAVSLMLAEGGLERQTLSPGDIARIEPTLHGKFYGGFFTPSDCTGDIHKFTRGLAAACARRNARFQYEASVDAMAGKDDGVRIDWHSTGPLDAGAANSLIADRVVICAGVGSRRLAAMVGDRVNIYPVKGYSLTVNLSDEPSRRAAPWVSILDDAAKIVTSRLGADRLRIAGTAEINGMNRDIRADRIAPLLGWTERFFPDIETSSAIPWAGLRPMMPNMMPRVGRGKSPNVFYNTGHGHLGWTTSCATAQLVAEAVDGCTPGIPSS